MVCLYILYMLTMSSHAILNTQVIAAIVVHVLVVHLCCWCSSGPSRSEFIYRERLGLSGHDVRLVDDEAPHGPPAAPPGSPFALAWRNYIKAVFAKGFMYSLSLNPSVVLYVSENKTLAGKEDRTYEGEASGRKLAICFFEAAAGNLVQRVNRETLAMKLELLTIAEIVQACGFNLPPDPERSSAASELLLEARYQNLEIERFVPLLNSDAEEVHLYSLGEGQNAEEALALKLAPAHRTKMVLSRCLQRSEALQDDETLLSVWSLPLAVLQGRAAPLLAGPPVPVAAAPPAPAAPGGPPAVPAPGGPPRGRGRGHGAPPRGRGLGAPPGGRGAPAGGRGAPPGGRGAPRGGGGAPPRGRGRGR